MARVRIVTRDVPEGSNPMGIHVDVLVVRDDGTEVPVPRVRSVTWAAAGKGEKCKATIVVDADVDVLAEADVEPK